jgi:diguanylate cyclase (GGDEF)-like protein
VDTAGLYRQITRGGLSLPKSNVPSLGLGFDDGADFDGETGRFEVPEGFRKPVEAGRDRPVLVRVGGSMNGQVCIFRKQEVTIGRSARASWRLYDLGVSRHHARMLRHRGKFYLEDLKSTNGTFVGGRRIGRTELAEGDLIQFGPVARFRFALVDELSEASMLQLFEGQSLDPLTGAFNQQYLNQALEREVAFAERHDTNLALVLLELDGFRKYTDTFGQDGSDELLASLVEQIRDELRTEDVLCRYGADDFAILCRDIDADGAERVAKRVLERAELAACELHRGTRGVTVCAGAACLSDLSEIGAVELWAKAKSRLERARERGAGAVQVRSDLPHDG